MYPNAKDLVICDALVHSSRVTFEISHSEWVTFEISQSEEFGSTLGRILKVEKLITKLEGFEEGNLTMNLEVSLKMENLTPNFRMRNLCPSP